MTRRSASLVAVLVFLAGCGEEGAERDAGEREPRPRRPAHAIRYGGPLAHREVRPRLAGVAVDLVSLRLLLHVDAAGKGADVQATLVLGMPQGTKSGKIRLQSVSWVLPEQVLCGGIAVPYRKWSDVLDLDLPAGTAEDRQVEVEIYYSLPHVGLEPSGTLSPGEDWYPGRGPGDPFEGEIEVFRPEGMGIVATGLPLPRESAGSGMVRERFLLEEATGLLGLAWAPGEAVSFEAGGTDFRCLTLGPDDQDRVRETFLGLMSLFGPCPRNAVSIAGVAPEGFVGTAGPGFVAVDARRASSAALAHVLAHQWWPGRDGDEALALFAESSLAPPDDPALLDGLFAAGGIFAGSEELLSLARMLGELETERRYDVLDRYRQGGGSAQDLAAALDAEGHR